MCGVTQKRYARPKVGVSFTHANGRDPSETEVREHEGADRGRSPQGVRVAVAVVDEVGELLECGTFLQNRAGLRALENALSEAVPRAALGDGERWWPRGLHLAQRLAAAGESVVDVPPKLSARVRVLSTGSARKNDGLDALATALAAWRNERLAAVDAEVGSEVLRLLSERREDLVAERTRALKAACTGSYGTSSPAG